MGNSGKKLKFKITVIGDGRVGKTSLIKKFTLGTFETNYVETIGAQFSKFDKEIEKLGYKVIYSDTDSCFVESNAKTPEQAEKIGKDRSSVANTLRLLNLPEEVQKLISNGKLFEGHARAILSLSTEKEKIDLSRRVVKEGLSVRKIEDLVYGKKKTHVTKQKPKISSEFFEMEEKLKQFFGTSVKVVGKGKGGRIEIEFYSEEDLSRILELLQITL